MDAFLDLQRLTKIFTARGEVRAVDDVSIAIGKGELVTLLGPSGCGKTTTLRMIAGFEHPDEGRIVLDDRDITGVPPNRRDTAMVFQSYAIFPHLTVDENIAYGLRVRRLSNTEVRRRVEAIVEVAGLQGLLQRQPNQLSITTIRSDSAITAVYVTHDQAEAMALSDRIVVMNRGRVEQAAPPTDIYQRPATPFVAEFIGQANFLPGRIEAVNGESARVSVLGQVVEAGVPAGAAHRTGETVTVVVRPEGLSLRSHGADGEGVVGEVRRAVYLGAVAEYGVRVAGDQTVTVALHGPAARHPHRVGQRVTVELLAGAGYVLPGVHQAAEGPAGTADVGEVRDE
jgi:iron(III) transport system ATP-binding protein